jgi:hypothetical protein
MNRVRLGVPAEPRKEHVPMIAHAASCLNGPITHDREWWRNAAEDDQLMACRHPQPQHTVKRPTDQLDVCPPGAPSETAEVRWDLVQRIRQEIAAGTYDTPEKLEIALERLRARLLAE